MVAASKCSGQSWIVVASASSGSETSTSSRARHVKANQSAIAVTVAGSRSSGVSTVPEGGRVGSDAEGLVQVHVDETAQASERRSVERQHRHGGADLTDER